MECAQGRFKACLNLLLFLIKNAPLRASPPGRLARLSDWRSARPDRARPADWARRRRTPAPAALPPVLRKISLSAGFHLTPERAHGLGATAYDRRANKARETLDRRREGRKRPAGFRRRLRGWRCSRPGARGFGRRWLCRCRRACWRGRRARFRWRR